MTVKRANEFESLLADGHTPSQEQVIEIIIKAADISNPTRPMEVSKKWVDGVMAEFFAQGDAEKARGLSISMNCDRETVLTSKCQLDFINFHVMAIFKSLCCYAPAVQPLIDQMEMNKHRYN